MKIFFNIIIISFNITILSYSGFAQERNILYRNDTVSIIHDYYKNKSYESDFRIKYPNTNLFYIIESNSIDTFATPDAKVLKIFYQKNIFSILVKYNNEESFGYAIYEKRGNQWNQIVTDGAFIPFSSDSNDSVNIEQQDIYTIKIDINSHHRKVSSIHKFDIQRRKIVTYDLLKENKIKEYNFPEN